MVSFNGGDVMIFPWIPKKEKTYTMDTVLQEALISTKQDLDSAYTYFDSVTEPDLIDSSIYQLKAAQLRYTFLLNQLKTKA